MQRTYLLELEVKLHVKCRTMLSIARLLQARVPLVCESDHDDDMRNVLHEVVHQHRPHTIGQECRSCKAICGIGVGVCPCSAYVADMVMCPLSLCVVMEKWHMMQLNMFIM